MNPQEPMITEGQRYALTKAISAFAPQRHCRLWILSQFFGREIKSSADLTLTEWRTFRNKAYREWANGNWELADAMKSEINKLVERYDEEVMGQQKLFK